MKLTLGLDAEFLFTEKDSAGKYQVKSARDFFSRYTGKLGTDTCSTLAEVRPAPNEEPKLVVANIQKIFRNYCQKKPELTMYDWKAGSAWKTSYALGGHLHYGFVEEDGSAYPYHCQDTAKVLDVYLSSLVLLFENTNDAKQRRKHLNYGRLGAARSQRWGMEYRTLPSFIVSPFITESVLTVGKVIVWQVWKDGDDIFNKFPIINKLSANYRFKNNFNECHKEYFQKIRAKIMNDLSQFELYEKYETLIKNFNQFLITNPEFDLNQITDFKVNWGINAIVQKQVVSAPAEEVWNAIQQVRF